MQDGPGARESSSMVRSEERLVVGTEWRPYVRYRVTKRVVVEEVTRVIEVRREEVYLEPVELTALERLEAAGGLAKPGEDELEVRGEIEMVLHREEVISTKHVVPYERVLISRCLIGDSEVVRENLRKERIEIERHPAS